MDESDTGAEGKLVEDPPVRRDFWEDLSEDARRARRLVLAAVMMAIFMTAIDSYIVATAMPTIVADLGGFRLFSWAFAAYLLTQAVSIPIYGRLADLYGRKRVFFAGTSLFLVGSALCGFSWSMGALIVFRALEGVGAGAIQPIATTIIGDIYAPVERARMQGYISGMFGVAAVIGPTLGAFVVEHVGWPVVFWVNLPIGAATFVMFGRFLHEDRERHAHRIDLMGSGLIMLGVGAPMLAVVQIGHVDELTLAGLALAGTIALALFVTNERRAAEPMLPAALWRNRVVAIGCLGGFFNGATMMALSGFMPTYVQGAMGLTAIASGIVLAASSVSWALASFAGGRLMIRTSYRLAATVGGICLVVGSLVLVALDPAGSLFWPSLGAFVLGVGMGFCNTAFIVSIQASVGWSERGMATSATMFMRIVGQSVGAALFGAVLNFGIARHLPGGADMVNRLLAPVAREHLGAAEIARASAAIAAALHNVYIVAVLVASVGLALALALPSRLSPTRPQPGR